MIIVNWNTRELLAQCLESLSVNAPRVPHEVLVVDNASSDGSAEMVRDRFPSVQLIANTTNAGFAVANNQGMRCSRGKYLLLLNSDTRVLPGALDTITSYLDAHPAVGLAGVRLLNNDGTRQYYATDFPNVRNQMAMLWRLPGRQRFLIGETDGSEPCEVERVKGACMAVRAEMLAQIGLLDETLFLYGEEDDLCYRGRQAGWKIVFLPQALVTHYGGASTEQVSGPALIHLYRSKLWFVQKYYGRGDAIALKFVIALAYLARIVIDHSMPGRGPGGPQRRSHWRLIIEVIRFRMPAGPEEGWAGSGLAGVQALCTARAWGDGHPPAGDAWLARMRARLRVRIRHAQMHVKYLLGDPRPAQRYLEDFQRTATLAPVAGRVGQLRGYSSQTVVADVDLATPHGPTWGDGRLVVKFEIRPGEEIGRDRLAGEYANEHLARRYLDRFMPPTLRIIGHGLYGKRSALVYQTRVPGRVLREIRWRDIMGSPDLQANLVEFCSRVEEMARATGRIPDLSGTLPRVDHLTNIFWKSRNVVVDPGSGQVWLVDTGWKQGQEILDGGSLRQRGRTWFRFYTLRLFHWRLRHVVASPAGSAGKSVRPRPRE